MKVLYTATTDAHPEEENQSPHFWASLDNESWLETNVLPTAEDYEGVVNLFQPQKGMRHGKSVHFSPMQMATRGLRLFCVNPVFHKPIPIYESNIA